MAVHNFLATACCCYFLFLCPLMKSLSWLLSKVSSKPLEKTFLFHLQK